MWTGTDRRFRIPRGCLRLAKEAAGYRETRRGSEDEFLRMSRMPGTVILDARSREKFDELRVKGAVNLSFPDIAIESLQRALPGKNARILFYCNNNFRGNERAFARKRAAGRRSGRWEIRRAGTESRATPIPPGAPCAADRSRSSRD